MLIYDIHWYPFDGAFSPLITYFKLIKRGYLKREKFKRGIWIHTRKKNLILVPKNEIFGEENRIVDTA